MTRVYIYAGSLYVLRVSWVSQVITSQQLKQLFLHRCLYYRVAVRVLIVITLT